MNAYKTVDEFVSSLDESKRKQVQTLRKLIMKEHPELREHIKWNSPSYVYNGEDRITFNVRDTLPLMIILHMGSKRMEDKSGTPVLYDTSGLIEWKSDIRGIITFRNLDDIEHKRKSFIHILDQW